MLPLPSALGPPSPGEAPQPGPPAPGCSGPHPIPAASLSRLSSPAVSSRRSAGEGEGDFLFPHRGFFGVLHPETHVIA